MVGRGRTVARAPLLLAVVALMTSACISGGPAATTTPSASSLPATVEPAPVHADAFVRVDQVGYPTGEPFMAFLLSRRDATGSTYSLVRDGDVISSGPIGKDMGAWSDTFPHVYAIGATAGDPGTYTLEIEGTVVAISPTFLVDTPQNLFAPMLANARTFYEAQRDGPDVIRSVLDRRPSHLHDRNAPVYERLAFTPDYVPKTPVRAAGAPRVDVSGGWFDAGDYIKGVQTASYAAAMLLVGVRDFPDMLGAGRAGRLHRRAPVRAGLASSDVGRPNPHALLPGGDRRRVGRVRRRPRPLAAAAGRRQLPAEGSRLPVRPAPARVSCGAARLTGQPESRRPVRRRVRVVRPGLRELASDFAARCLASGEHVYAMADTRRSGCVTFAPWAFYPETEWHSDMELGAIELTRAVAGLPAGSSEERPLLRDEAARWAFAGIHGPQADQAHAESLRRQRARARRAARVAGLAATRPRACRSIARRCSPTCGGS